jgi:hypothetical protein
MVAPRSPSRDTSAGGGLVAREIATRGDYDRENPCLRMHQPGERMVMARELLKGSSLARQ